MKPKKEVIQVAKKKEAVYEYQMDTVSFEQLLNRKIQEFYSRLSIQTEDLTVKQRASAVATALNRFEKELKDFIQTNNVWNAEVQKYLTNFDILNKLNGEMYWRMGLDDKEKIKKLIEYAEPQQKDMIKKITDDMTGRGMEAEFVQPVKQMMYRNVILGTPVNEGKEILKTFVLGDKEKEGKLKRYAGQISRDALSQYDGQINSMIAEQYELDTIQYIGSLVTDSRPICKHIINEMGGIIPKEELPGLLARFEGSGGMIPGTTPENFMVYRGGYNCRHIAIAFNQNI